MVQSIITRKVEFDAGHRIPSHDSKCRNPHGHRYVVEATVSGPIISESGRSDEGMVVDFGNLKGIMQMAFSDSWDHAFLVYQDDPLREKLEECAELFDKRKIIVLPFPPTVELLARQAFLSTHQRILGMQDDVLPDHRCSLSRLRMYETPNCWADATAETVWSDQIPQ